MVVLRNLLILWALISYGAFANGIVPIGVGVDLPDLGDESAAVISPSQERKLGEDVMRQARHSLKYLDDPELLDYIQRLGDKLVAQADYPHKFQFYVVDDANINAFAVPGGFISTNTGLILAAESEAELASVLAHEAAHITQRHIPRMIAGQKRTSGLSMAALLAAILLIGSGQGEAGEAAIALSGATLAQRQINFTRAHEQEADRVGTQILVQGGFDPRAMPAFFQRLQNWSRLYETNLPEYLSTHPITSNRIAESLNRAERYPPIKTSDSPDFHHVRAKIRAMTASSPARAVEAFKTSIARGKSANADAEHYGYAFALLSNRQYDEARKEISALLKRHPDNIYYRLLQAEIEMAAGHYTQALKIDAATYAKAPGNRAVMGHYAGALLQTGEAKTARKLLDEAVRQYPDDPSFYKMLATAAGETGDRFAAHYALAEHYYLIGNLSSAVKQLEIAARFTGESDYYRARVQARIKDIKSEIDQQRHE